MMNRKMLVFGCSLIAAGSALAGRLPAEAEATYMEVPSLTARYGQYIDTGYSVPANAELRFKFTMTKTAAYQCPFGTYTDANTLCTRLARNNNDANNYLVYFRSNANNGWVLVQNVTASESDAVEGYMNASKLKLNAREVNFDPKTGGAFDGAADGKTLLLFTQKADAAPKPVTIYSFSILEGDETKHDYVPCCRRSDGKTGLYDSVAREFLPTQFGTHESAQQLEMTFGNDRLEIVGSPTAKGTVTPAYGVQEGLTNGQPVAVSAPAHLVGVGTCVCCAGYNLYTNVPGDASAWGLWKRGSENSFTYVHPATASVRLEWVWNEYSLPAGCQPLLWLKSDGGQFVDTGYKANVKTFYRFKYAMKPVGYSGPFGTYTGPTVNCTRIIASNGSSTSLLVYFLSSGQDGWMQLPGVTKNAGEDVSGFLAYDKVQLNGVTYPLTCREPAKDRPNPVGSEDARTAYLFRVNSGTGAEVTMYAFAIFEDNVLLHDYLPCERSGKGVMVDLVTGDVLENGGTGDFICGPEDHPGDATVYSWKASVTEGDWTNAANWAAEGPAEVGYPAGSLSTAKFPTGTRATVRLPERALTFKTLSLKETDLKVKFVGGVRDSTGAFQNVMTAIVSEGVSESVAAGAAQNNEIVFDGVAVSSPEYLVVGVGSRLVLTNAAEFTCGKGVMMGYGTGAVLTNPTAGYLDVKDGSLLKVAKEINLASRFVLTVDDARVQAEMVQFGCNTPGGTVCLAGTHPEMLLTVYVRNMTAGDEGGFLFQLPADGYVAPPVRSAGDVVNQERQFGGRDSYSGDRKLRVDVESAFAPGTCCRKSRNPLVTAISGVNVNTVIFDNRTGCPGNFLYGEELQEPYGWHAVSEFPAGQKPKSIGIYLPRGLKVIVK